MQTHKSGVTQDPFSLDLTRQSRFRSLKGESVSKQIAHRIRICQGILLVIGEAGVGKTTLLEDIADQLASEVTFVTSKSQSNSLQELITDLFNGLGLEDKNTETLPRVRWLMDYQAENKQGRIAFVIDRADGLPDEILGKLLLLSFLLSDDQSSLQIILVGTPDLEPRIYQLGLTASANYTTHCCRIDPLDPTEMSDYIQMRLKAVHGHEKAYFTPDAIMRIAFFSNGRLALINKLCRLAWVMAGTESKETINGELIDKVADILLFDPTKAGDGNEMTSQDQAMSADVTDTAAQQMVSQISDDEAPSLIERAYSSSAEPDPSGPTVTQNGERSQSFADETLQESYEPETAGRTIATWLCSRTAQYATWGLATLVMGSIGFLLYQTHISPSGFTSDTGLTVADRSPSDSGGQSKSESSTRGFFGAFSTKSVRSIPHGVATGQTAASGDNARRFIYELEAGEQMIVLGKIVKKAEYWSNHNQWTDAYLLYFYAARQGDGNAAFKLAQLYDPTTFRPGIDIVDAPSLLQADKWYRHASRAGHPQSDQYLDNIRILALNRAAEGDEKALRLTLQFR